MEDRYWLNYDNFSRGKSLSDMVALVDEKVGGEIAYFSDQRFAIEICRKLNALETIIWYDND